MSSSATEPTIDARTGPTETTAFERVVEHLRTPLHRNAYALVASGAITSVLGLVYWMVAARRYSESDVGVGAAAVSSMMLLANASGLGLQNGFVRLIPSAGRRTRSFVVRSMAAAACTAALLSTIFLVGLPVWAHRLVPLLRQSPWTWLAFIGSTVVWVLFVLQDTALIGLRRATVVPVENIGFSVAKIAIVVAFAASLPEWGVYASWPLAAGLAVAAISGVVLPRFLNRASLVGRRDELPSGKALVRYLGAEHASVMLWMATVELVPLIVLQRLGATSNAYYYLAAQLASALMLLPTAIGVSLTAEAATDPSALQGHVRKGARNIAIVMVPAVTIVVAFASIGLKTFGKGYSAEGSTLLRLMALGALPYSATLLLVSVARVQRRMRMVMTTYFALSTLTFGLTLALLGPLGLAGAGVASLLAQTIVAAVVLVTQLHQVGVRGVDRILADLVDRPRSALRRRAAARVVGEVVPEMLGIGTVHSVEILASRNDVIVARLRTSLFGTQVLKVSESPGAAAAVRRATSAMMRIVEEVPSVARYVPTPTHAQTVDSRICSLEEFRSGDTGAARLATHSLSLRSLTSGLEVAGRLHRDTSREVLADSEWLERFVDGPIARVRRIVQSEVTFERLDALRGRLHAELGGRVVHVSTIHGDLAPGNLLYGLDSSDVTALLDWESSTTDALPEIDLFQFLFALRTATEGRELDDVVPSMLSLRSWSLRDTALVDEAEASRPNLATIGLWSAVTLAWLAHVDSNLGKARWYRESSRWMSRNVESVLDQLTRPGLAERDVRPRFDGRRSTVAETVNRTILEITVDEESPSVPALEPVPAVEPADTSAPPTSPAAHRRGPGGIVVTPGRIHASLAEEHGLFGVLGRPQLSIPVAVVLWVLGVRGVDLREMSAVGLLSVVHPIAYVGLGVLVVSILANLAATRPNGWHLGPLLAAFIALIHGTPAALYTALRYSWAWKHVGIVDYVIRQHGVDPSIGSLAVYHQWPGFFAGAATLTKAVGAQNALAIASWAPVAFNLLNLAVLLLVLSSLADDRRAVWLGVTLFFVTNWVGQDYFSPQALTYVLYLGALGLVLQRFRRDPVDLPGRSWNAAPTAALVVALIVAIATSHQLTPVMLTVALATLALTRRTRTWRFALVSLAVNVVWGLTFARRFVSSQLSGVLDRFGAVTDNTSGTIQDTAAQSSGQALVSTMGRAALVLIGLVAVIGFVRRWRSGRREWTVAVLAALPGAVLVANDYGGEAVFRVVLFAMPFVALLAAWAFVPQSGRPWALGRQLSVIAVTGLLLTGFLFGYYGKERQYSFTADEVGATAYLEDHSAPNSLLVTINANYPNLVEGYERFVTVPIGAEPPESRERVLDDPATVLAGWLANPDYSDTSLLITRSQLIAVEDLGDLDLDAVDSLVRSIRSSDRFVAVYDTPDATVFRLAGAADVPTSATDVVTP